MYILASGAAFLVVTAAFVVLYGLSRRWLSEMSGDPMNLNSWNNRAKFRASRISNSTLVFNSPNAGVALNLRTDLNADLVAALTQLGVNTEELNDLKIALAQDAGSGESRTIGVAVQQWTSHVAARLGRFSELALATAAGNITSTLLLLHYGVVTG